MDSLSASLVALSLVKIGNISLHFQPPSKSGAGHEATSALPKLGIRWSDPQETIDTYSLLTWRTHRSFFAARETEMAELLRWAHLKPKVSVRFVTATGGAGKSRLAAEFADKLENEGWSAGFVDLRNPAVYQGGAQGTLIIVDYPEEHREAVKTLLGDLAQAGLSQRVRVLFLTRCSMEEWRSVIDEERANSLVDWNPVRLNELTPEEGHAVYHGALEFAAENEGTEPSPLPVDVVGEWMHMVPQNALPLFLVATAVFSAQNPEEEIITYSGPKVIAALNKREATRLHKASKEAGLSEDALALALTYATLCKGVPLKEFRDKPKLCKLLGLKKGKPWADLLAKSGHLVNGTLRHLEPDIVGADFVHATLARNKDKAPELVWRTAARNPEAAIGTLGRLIYDAQDILGRAELHVHHWLLKALEKEPTRCIDLESWFNKDLPIALARCGVFICQQLSSVTSEEGKKARYLGRIGSQQRTIGRHREALVPLQGAVVAQQSLARKNPARYEPDLSVSLHNLSNCLSALGQRREALEAIQKAVAIYRRLAVQEPLVFEPELAGSLNNLSNRLSDLNQQREAQEALQEAVSIYHRLAAQEPALFEPYLAGSMNNLSNRLSDLGQQPEALVAIQKACAIYSRLAAQEPARFEPYLAMSLNTLSSRLHDLGQHREALEATPEAIAIYRRLAKQEPAAYEPYLASNLSNLSIFLSALGQYHKALEASQEAVELFKRHAEHNFLGIGRNLAQSLMVLADTLTALNRHEEAAAAQAEAEDIMRRLEEAQKAEAPQE